jgi:hypothetical protein
MPPPAKLAAVHAVTIIIGHSAGGVFNQILLDHGFGAAGVAIDSAPTEGVKVVPLSEIKSGLPIVCRWTLTSWSAGLGWNLSAG